jgi:hypothetical protein
MRLLVDHQLQIHRPEVIWDLPLLLMQLPEPDTHLQVGVTEPLPMAQALLIELKPLLLSP